MLGPSTCLAIEVPGSVCRARSTVYSEYCLLQHIAVAPSEIKTSCNVSIKGSSCEVNP